jgi:hypothetical protein
LLGVPSKLIATIVGGLAVWGWQRWRGRESVIVEAEKRGEARAKASWEAEETALEAQVAELQAALGRRDVEERVRVAREEGREEGYARGLRDGGVSLRLPHLRHLQPSTVQLTQTGEATGGVRGFWPGFGHRVHQGHWRHPAHTPPGGGGEDHRRRQTTGREGRWRWR